MADTPRTPTIGAAALTGVAAGRVHGTILRPRGVLRYVPSLTESALDILTGPVKPIDATAYDTTHLAQAAFWVGDTFGGSMGPGTTSAPKIRHYYDGALTYYLLYYRTGDAQWAARGDFLAQEYADYQMDPANNVPQRIVGGPAEGGSQLTAKDFATLGMAVYYLRTGYQPALDAVRCQAAGAEFYNPRFVIGSANRDTRTCGYRLMALLASTLLPGGPDYSATMLECVDAAVLYQGDDQTAGSTQSPHSSWQLTDTGSQVPALYFDENFMAGLYTESLIMYDRVIGDARIVPMIKDWADWLWSTQWVALGGGDPTSNPMATSTTSLTIGSGSKSFTTQSGLGLITGQPLTAVSRATGFATSMLGTVTSYSGTSLVLNSTEVAGSGTHTDWDMYVSGYPGDQTATGIGTMQYATTTSGTVSTTSNADFSDLMGILLPTFGYLSFKGQGSQYKTRGDAMVAGMLQSPWFLLKQFSQGFRSSPRYIGWTT